MALSKVSDATLEVVKDHFVKWCIGKETKKLSLLITGKTGVGKSSLVNALVGKAVAKVGRDKDRCTDQVTSYDIDIEGVKIRVWDTPGLRDDDDDDEEDEEEYVTRNDKKYLVEMQSKIKEKLDLVIFCLRMDDEHFQRDDKQTFKILTDCFGKELWKNAVMALTFANRVEDPDGGDREAYFRQDLAKWQNKIKSFLSKKIKLDPEWVQSLKLVPTGYYLSTPVLPDGKKWLSTFWIACYKAARRSATFNLYLINTAKIRFPESKKLAVVCGGSEVVSTSTRRREKLSVVCGGSELAPTTPGLDDSEMPPIDLDEEQQESFWNTTWEAFKEHCSTIGVVLGGICAVAGAGILRLLVR